MVLLKKNRISPLEKKDFVSRVASNLEGQDFNGALDYFSFLKKDNFFPYKDFIVLTSRAYNKAGFSYVCSHFLKKEYEENVAEFPGLASCYAEALLASNSIVEFKKVVSENFDLIEAEWTKLELVELLCDAHCWNEACDWLPQLTYSGDASRNKYNKIKTRISMTMQYDKEPEIEVLYINLDKDTVKKERIEKHLSECVTSFTRVPGVLAKNLPALARKKLHRSSILDKQVGALGCFLAHINALERVIEQKFQVALIMEDDAYFYYLPSEYAINEILKNEYDVVYVNSRMMKRDSRFETPLNVDPIHKRLSILDDSISGWGGDGYLVTNSGARKLLENFSYDLGLGHYDGQLGAYGLIEKNVPVTNKATRVGMNFARKMSKKSSMIKCGCLDFPLVSFKEYTNSSRISNS